MTMINLAPKKENNNFALNLIEKYKKQIQEKELRIDFLYEHELDPSYRITKDLERDIRIIKQEIKQIKLNMSL